MARGEGREMAEWQDAKWQMADERGAGAVSSALGFVILSFAYVGHTPR